MIPCIIYFTDMTTSFIFLQKNSKIALSYFSLIVLLGVFNLPIKHHFIAHIHSHTTLLD